MSKTCYFCTEDATSREHVPPQCIFPELKDTPDARNYRVNLITVPACDAHNSAKSEDDTYLMMVLLSYFQNNNAAQNQINSKLIRALENNKKLASVVAKNPRKIQVLGQMQYAYEVDIERFDRSLELVSHGLHFYAFKSKPENPYKVISYPIAKLEGPEANEVNLGRANMLALADQLLAGVSCRGSNPDIFWYQIFSCEDGRYVIRMCFYGAFVVVALSSATMSA